jgi:hypothetical protein
MIRHVVLLQFAAESPDNRHELALVAKEKLESLANGISGVVAIDVHEDLQLIQGHWHIILVADFHDYEALESYQVHAKHVEVLEWLNSGVVADRAVIDFEVSENAANARGR